jgi:hypothetical protein
VTARRLLLGLSLLALLVACSADSERPEGIVERWLLSLNQGAAGRPDLYAPDEVSEQVIAGWRDLEPGHLDQIEIGTDLGSPMCEERCADVPFRIVDLDGDVTEGIAIAEALSPGDWRIVRVEPGDAGLSGDASAWSIAGASPAAWLLALATAVALTTLAVLIVRLVRVPEREPA